MKSTYKCRFVNLVLKLGLVVVMQLCIYNKATCHAASSNDNRNVVVRNNIGEISSEIYNESNFKLQFELGDAPISDSLEWIKSGIFAVSGSEESLAIESDDSTEATTLTNTTPDSSSETTESTTESAELTDSTNTETGEITESTTELGDLTTTTETAEITDSTTESTDSTDTETEEVTDSTTESTDSTTEITDATTESSDLPTETTESTDESTELTDSTTELIDATTELTDSTTESTSPTTDLTDSTTEETASTTELTDSTTEQTSSSTELTPTTTTSTTTTTTTTTEPPPDSSSTTTSTTSSTESTTTTAPSIPIPIPENEDWVTEDEVGRDDLKTYNFQLPPEGITISLQIRGGDLEWWYSFTNPNPSGTPEDIPMPSNSPVFIRPPAQEGQEQRSKLLSLLQLQSTVSNVYIGVLGLRDKNEFTLVARTGTPEPDVASQIHLSAFLICFTFTLFLSNNLLI